MISAPPPTRRNKIRMTLYKKFSKQFQVNIPQGEMRKHQTKKKTKKILITKYSIKSTKTQKNSFLSFLPKLMKNKQLYSS
jgi:hypothetical protein